MKRIWILLVISLVGVGLFTACSSNADTMVQPSPSPSVSPSASPTATATDSPAPSAAPTITDKGMEAGVNTVEDAQRVSDEVSEEVEKLSELKSAEAVVMGTIAVVGVEYDAQYQEGMTDLGQHTFVVVVVAERSGLRRGNVQRPHQVFQPHALVGQVEIAPFLAGTGHVHRGAPL